MARQMQSLVRPGKQMKRFLSLLFYFLAFVALSMSLLCSYKYASLGLDRDEKNPPMVLSTHYRLRWPGNGTLMIGGSSQRNLESKDHPFEAFDIGGTFGEPSHDDISHVLGFGYINAVWEDAHNKAHPDDPKLWSKWLCIPAFLPAPLFAFIAMRLARKTHKA
jgi:hypothetical protein